MKAPEKYTEQYNEIQNELSVLKTKLKKNKSAFERESANWGYVGSITHINVLPKEINLFWECKLNCAI